ncbi:MAG: RNA polymerase sigma-70 factor, ECF subfamily [Parcubacteria group bacterium Gr01-1014_72]|nr:MAG: RNA polymerase sigma-70 factor, ECF subfamily [Parcubacteria group bacterium Gr01-1014_72]
MMLLDDATVESPVRAECSDEEVLTRSRTSPNAFQGIVERYEDAFLRKARHLLGDRPELQDIVQDTFVKIYLNAHTFTPQEGASFKSWGYKILVNTCFTFYKKRKRERILRADIPEEFLELVPEEDSKAREEKLDKDFLISAIVRLPDILQRVVRLHFLEGKSQREVARIEDISEGTNM